MVTEVVTVAEDHQVVEASVKSHSYSMLSAPTAEINAKFPSCQVKASQCTAVTVLKKFQMNATREWAVVLHEEITLIVQDLTGHDLKETTDQVTQDEKLSEKCQRLQVLMKRH